jgi:hypothetical protein
MKLLSPRIHGYLDYLAVVVLLAAPMLLRFSAVPATLCALVAVAHLVVSMATDRPASLAKRIPARVHLVFERVIGVGLAVSPWLLGFSHEPAARRFVVVFGLALLAVSAASQAPAKAVPFDRYGG